MPPNSHGRHFSNNQNQDVCHGIRRFLCLTDSLKRKVFKIISNNSNLTNNNSYNIYAFY